MCPGNYLYVPLLLTGFKGPALLSIYYEDSGRRRAGVLFSRTVYIAVAFSLLYSDQFRLGDLP